MQFCSECNNLMKPAENVDALKLMYMCENCNVDPVEADANDIVVYTQNRRETQEERQVSWKDIPYDPTLQRAQVSCPICSHDQAVFYEVQQGDSITLYFVCANVHCTHHWTQKDVLAALEAEAEAEAHAASPTKLDDGMDVDYHGQVEAKVQPDDIDDLF